MKRRTILGFVRWALLSALVLLCASVTAQLPSRDGPVSAFGPADGKGAGTVGALWSRYQMAQQAYENLPDDSSRAERMRHAEAAASAYHDYQRALGKSAGSKWDILQGLPGGAAPPDGVTTSVREEPDPAETETRIAVRAAASDFQPVVQYVTSAADAAHTTIKGQVRFIQDGPVKRAPAVEISLPGSQRSVFTAPDGTFVLPGPDGEKEIRWVYFDLVPHLTAVLVPQARMQVNGPDVTAELVVTVDGQPLRNAEVVITDFGLSLDKVATLDAELRLFDPAAHGGQSRLLQFPSGPVKTDQQGRVSMVLAMPTLTTREANPHDRDFAKRFPLKGTGRIEVSDGSASTTFSYTIHGPFPRLVAVDRPDRMEEGLFSELTLTVADPDSHAVEVDLYARAQLRFPGQPEDFQYQHLGTYVALDEQAGGDGRRGMVTFYLKPLFAGGDDLMALEQKAGFWATVDEEKWNLIRTTLHSGFTLGSPHLIPKFASKDAVGLMNVLNADVGLGETASIALYNTFQEGLPEGRDAAYLASDLYIGVADLGWNILQLVKDVPSKSIAVFEGFKIGWEVNKIITKAADKNWAIAQAYETLVPVPLRVVLKDDDGFTAEEQVDLWVTIQRAN